MATPMQNAYVAFNDLIQYGIRNHIGGLYTTKDQVLYDGVIYQYNAQGTAVTPATNPVTYKTPDTDASAVALYTLGVS